MKKDLACNIFSIHTTYHERVVRGLIDSLYSGDKNIIIATINVKKYNNTQTYKLPTLTVFLNVLKEILKRKRKAIFKQIFSSVDQNYSSVRIFIPPYLNINANYLANNRLIQNYQIYNYPDGILSHYIFKPSISTYIIQLRNIIVAKLIGLNYRMCYSDIINPFNNVYELYSYDPELSNIHAVTTRQIPFTRKRLQHNRCNIVILGSDIYINEHYQIVEKIFNIVYNISGKIYYKPHPRLINDKMYHYINENINSSYSLEIMNERCGIEEVIEKYNIKTIISFSLSTAHVEVQRKYYNALECYAYINPKLRLFHTFTNLELLLQKYNINEI